MTQYPETATRWREPNRRPNRWRFYTNVCH